MTTTTNTTTEPKYELCAPTFPTQAKAANWAHHVARTGQRRCRVTKIGEHWRVSATPMRSEREGAKAE